MNRAPLELVISEAKQEIDLIQAELRRIEALQRRMVTLEQFVLTAEQLATEGSLVRARANLNLVGINEVVRESRSEAAGLLPTERLWEAIQLIMQVRKKPMTPAEVLVALEAEKFKIQGEHRRETVRSAMSRKPDLFEKVQRGLYALKAWSEETKLSRQTELIEADDGESDVAENMA